jgi:hypothetical protein
MERTKRMAMMVAAAAVWIMGSWVAAQQSSPARVLPIGTQLDLLLPAELTSKTAKADDRFEATTVGEVMQQGQMVIPAGAVAHGFVGSVRASDRTNHQGQMTLAFEELQIGDQSMKLRASIVAVLDPRRRMVTTRAGAPIDLSDPGAPALLVGVVVSDGGSLLAAGGDVLLPVGAVLRVRLDRPIEIKSVRRP